MCVCWLRWWQHGRQRSEADTAWHRGLGGMVGATVGVVCVLGEPMYGLTYPLQMLYRFLHCRPAKHRRSWAEDGFHMLLAGLTEQGACERLMTVTTQDCGAAGACARSSREQRCCREVNLPMPNPSQSTLNAELTPGIDVNSATVTCCNKWQQVITLAAGTAGSHATACNHHHGDNTGMMHRRCSLGLRCLLGSLLCLLRCPGCLLDEPLLLSPRQLRLRLDAAGALLHILLPTAPGNLL